MLHHVTFAGFRYPTAICRVMACSRPCGRLRWAASDPMRPSLLPWGRLPSLVVEYLRGFDKSRGRRPFQMSQPARSGLTGNSQRALSGDAAGFQPARFSELNSCPRSDRRLRAAVSSRAEVSASRSDCCSSEISSLKASDLALLGAQRSRGSQCARAFRAPGGYRPPAETDRPAVGAGGRRYLDEAPTLARLTTCKSPVQITMFCVLRSLHDTGTFTR